MRIAIFSDDYLPDSTLVHAKMLHELALELISRGHQPIVITPESKSGASKLTIDKIDGVEVWRFKSGATRGVCKTIRAVNESLLSFNAWRAIRKKLLQEPIDGIVNYSPPIFLGPLICWMKRLCRCKSYLVLRDFFPQWVIDQGMISEHSIITYYFRFFEKLNYKTSDCIGVMSEKNLELFRQTFFENTPLEILRNWARPLPVLKDGTGSLLRKKYRLQDKILFLYGGNIGHAQDMDNLMRLARSMMPYSQAHFLFVGQGDEVELVNKRIEEWNLSNSLYLPSVPQEEFKQLLSEADVGLFSLAKQHTSHNFPGKLLGYMVESVPILGSINAGNDLSSFIDASGAGFVHVNGEDDRLLTSALKLLNEEELRVSMGKNANCMLHDFFSVASAAEQILDRLKK